MSEVVLDDQMGILVRDQVTALNLRRESQSRVPYNDIESGLIAQLAEQVFVPSYLNNGLHGKTPWRDTGSPEAERLAKILENVGGRRKNVLSRSAQALSKEVVRQMTSHESRDLGEHYSVVRDPILPVITDPNRGAFRRRSRGEKASRAKDKK